MTSSSKQQSQVETSEAVVAQIKERKLAPIPRSYFIVLNIMMWASGVGAVFIGALGVCMSIVVMRDAQWQGLLTQPHPELFILRAVPYLWIALLIIFIFFAHRFVQHTRRGYRLSPWHVLLGAVLASAVGGIILYSVGVGSLIVEYIDDRRPPMHALLIPHYVIWEDQNRGLLRGKILSYTDEYMHVVTPYGVEWVVDISRAQIQGTLHSDAFMRAVGEKIGEVELRAEYIYVDEDMHMRGGRPHWKRE